ncbi:MAG TPA: SAM-dependent methyltransferase [Frankiaceae bacterium]|nr:SAM-dependent methyltransferase [Frankiaceae bacterium]
MTPVTLRSRDEIAALFAGFDLVEPGLVRTPLWRPESPDDVDDDPERGFNLAGVGRKR